MRIVRPLAWQVTMIWAIIFFNAAFRSSKMGRDDFAVAVISCHSLVPISKYPAQRWPELVASMSKRAGLDDIQRAQVTAYLVAARKSLP
jgi:hypothetical protein